LINHSTQLINKFDNLINLINLIKHDKIIPCSDYHRIRLEEIKTDQTDIKDNIQMESHRPWIMYPGCSFYRSS
jgi:hypothetical protein